MEKKKKKEHTVNISLLLLSAEMGKEPLLKAEQPTQELGRNLCADWFFIWVYGLLSLILFVCAQLLFHPTFGWGGHFTGS